MDYYSRFIEGAKDSVKDLMAKRAEITRKINQAEKNLDTGRKQAGKYRDRLEKLETGKNDALTSPDYSFEKYRVALKKLTDDLQSAEICCETLSKTIPQLKDLRSGVDMNMEAYLRYYFLEKRKEVDVVIREHLDALHQHLDAAVDVRANCLAAFKKIYEEFGFEFSIYDAVFWAGRNWEDEHIRLRNLTDFIKEWNIKNKVDGPAVIETPASPETSQNEQEAIQIPPEAVSQAVEPQSAVNDVAGETPETSKTLLAEIIENERSQTKR